MYRELPQIALLIWTLFAGPVLTHAASAAPLLGSAVKRSTLEQPVARRSNPDASVNLSDLLKRSRCVLEGQPSAAPPLPQVLASSHRCAYIPASVYKNDARSIDSCVMNHGLARCADNV